MYVSRLTKHFFHIHCLIFSHSFLNLSTNFEWLLERCVMILDTWVSCLSLWKISLRSIFDFKDRYRDPTSDSWSSLGGWSGYDLHSRFLPLAQWWFSKSLADTHVLRFLNVIDRLHPVIAVKIWRGSPCIISFIHFVYSVRSISTINYTLTIIYWCC